MLTEWRKNNGLDYHGWWQYLLKRWLRRHRLGWMVPFDYAVDDHDDGISTLIVWRWGVRTVERWRWPSYRDQDLIDRVKRQGIIGRWTLYRLIRAEAQQIT